jgi:hypothetical protein
MERNYKNPNKAGKPLLVFCKLAECTYYEARSEANPDNAICSHPNKREHLSAPACPLFRLDWMKKLSAKR